MTDGEILRQLAQLRRSLRFGFVFMAAAVLGFAVAGRQPASQVDRLARFNADFLLVTCDSSYYSAEERQRRTVEERVRRARICAYFSARADTAS